MKDKTKYLLILYFVVVLLFIFSFSESCVSSNENDEYKESHSNVSDIMKNTDITEGSEIELNAHYHDELLESKDYIPEIFQYDYEIIGFTTEQLALLDENISELHEVLEVYFMNVGIINEFTEISLTEFDSERWKNMYVLDFQLNNEKHSRITVGYYHEDREFNILFFEE